MRYKNILFDFDGTIMDSGPGIIRCAVEMAGQYGLAVPDAAQLRKFVGPPVPVAIERVFGIPREQTKEMAESYRMLHRKTNAKLEGQVYPGVEALLTELNEAGANCAIASVKSQYTVYDTVEHFGLLPYFKAICGGDGKTTPDKAKIVLECMEKLGVADRETAILIGDTDIDAAGAQQVGIDFCAVLWGYGFETAEDVEKFDHTFIAKDMGELRQFLME